MKKIPLLLFILFISICSFSQNKENRNVGSFHAIEVSNGIDLTLNQGNATSVAVSASTPEETAKIKTVVENGKLKIYFDNNGMSIHTKNLQLKAYVTIKNIDDLEANSGADIQTNGSLQLNQLSIDLSSGAGMDGDIAASQISINESSGSDMTLKGKVQSLNVKTSSGANFKGYDLTTEACNADASSGSNIQITVTKELTAKASSGGGIDYKGSASVTSVKNSSGGRIKKQS